LGKVRHYIVIITPTTVTGIVPGAGGPATGPKVQNTPALHGEALILHRSQS
jgi:hypothetical protein